MPTSADLSALRLQRDQLQSELAQVGDWRSSSSRSQNRSARSNCISASQETLKENALDSLLAAEILWDIEALLGRQCLAGLGLEALEPAVGRQALRREMRLCAVWSAEGREEDNTSVRDPGSVPYSAFTSTAIAIAGAIHNSMPRVRVLPPELLKQVAK